LKCSLFFEVFSWSALSRQSMVVSFRLAIAGLLKPLGIGPENIGPEKGRVRGYKRVQFEDAFERYLAPEKAPKCTGAQNAPASVRAP
jgi:hypothetical protein